MGHATRCIPLIKALAAHGYEVYIGAAGAQEVLLKKEFPRIPFVHLKGYKVRYSRSKWLFMITMALQVPRLVKVIRYEHRWLAEKTAQYGFDLVLSDNRFGLYSAKIPSIFMTHQLTVKAPFAWMERLVQKINYGYINRFTTCWVPDAAGTNNLGGLLSHPAKMPEIPVQYIGLLSRFQQREVIKKYDYCILLSGPEPQRTMLEKKIIRQIAVRQEHILLVRGKPGSSEQPVLPANITLHNHLTTAELEVALMESGTVICRSGYTSLMELLSLQKKILLIPTPGQTEQEYLAARLNRLGWCMQVLQANLNLVKDMAAAGSFAYQPVDLPVFDPQELIPLLKAIV
ncbi:MAG: glycosyltransferase [Sediminibacterium sp.]